MGLSGTELHISVNFIFNWSWFYHYIKEKKKVLKAAGSSLLEKEAKSKDILQYHGTGKKKVVIFYLI